jgi:hypothetical protein
MIGDMNPLPAPHVPGRTDAERFRNAVRKIFSPENLTAKPAVARVPKKRAKKHG